MTLALIWGSNFALIKIGDRGFGPIGVAWGRIAVGAAVLLVIVGGRRLALPKERVIWLHSAVVGLMLNALPFSLFTWGETRTSSIVAGIFNSATPLMAMLVGIALIPTERPTTRGIAGLSIGFSGVLVVAGIWRGVHGGSTAGELAFLVATVCYGLGFPYARRFVVGRGHPTTSLACAQMVCATVELSLAAPFIVFRHPIHPGGAAIASVVGLGVGATAIGYILTYSLIAEIGATGASMVTYLTPLVAVVLGATVLSEPVSWNLPLGAAVIISGVALAEGRLIRRQVPRAPVEPVLEGEL